MEFTIKTDWHAEAFRRGIPANAFTAQTYLLKLRYISCHTPRAAVAKKLRPGRSPLLAIFLEGFSGVLDGLHGRFGAFPANDIELLVLKLVGRLEELFKLLLYGRERSRTSFKACSECESLGTANKRSLRSVLPLLFCSILRMPMTRQVRTMPGKVAASCTTMISIGSPSSALVEGTNPQSCGYVRPVSSDFESVNAPSFGS